MFHFSSDPSVVKGCGIITGCRFDFTCLLVSQTKDGFNDVLSSTFLHTFRFTSTEYPPGVMAYSNKQTKKPSINKGVTC